MNLRSVFMSVAVVAALMVFVACGSGTEPENDQGTDVGLDAAGELPPDSVVVPDMTDDVIGDDSGSDAVADIPVADAPGDVMPDVDLDAVDAADVEPDVPVVPDPALRLREQGWLIGDLHMHSTYSDGEDSVAVTVGLAEYFTDPDFLAFNPEYDGFALDYIALTDHRTAIQNSDPDFFSEKVVLIPGEEFGGPGHACLFGVTDTVNHNANGGPTTTEDYFDGLEVAGAMGAVRSINHPFTTGIYFPWDLHNYESMEIWNVKWAVSQPGASQATIDQWEAEKGATASVQFRKAAEYQGIGGNAQALKFYEVLLSRGHHIAVVGGSDRHTVFGIGFPATWIKSTSRDVSGILDAIRARHTFVNRTPIAATIEMTVEAGDETFMQGDQIPIPAEGLEVTIKLRTTRAAGGRLFLIGGHAIASDLDLEGAVISENDLMVAIGTDDFQVEYTTTVMPGDWFYPVVHEPLVQPGLDPDLTAQIPEIAATVAQISGENYSPLIGALFPYVDDLTFMSPENCDPAGWVAGKAQCLPPDNNGMATIMLPDWIDRVLNVVVENGQSSTEWCMGAAASAVLFVEKGQPE